MPNRTLYDVALGQVVVPQTLIGFSNLTATRDPTTTDDVTQGYLVGSEWFNVSAGMLRSWTCYSNGAGAAKWEFGGADFANGGTNPPSDATQAGSSTASIAAEGNIYREALAANGGRVPGQTGSGVFVVLGLATIPANFFDGALLPGGTIVGNRGVNVTAMGSMGAGNANTKRIMIVANPPVTAAVGGTLGLGAPGMVPIADTGSITVAGSGWSLQAEIFKFGVLGSNTQLALHQQAQVAASVFPLLGPQNLTLVESVAIPVAVIAQVTTLPNDVVYNFFELNAMN